MEHVLEFVAMSVIENRVTKIAPKYYPTAATPAWVFVASLVHPFAECATRQKISWKMRSTHHASQVQCV